MIWEVVLERKAGVMMKAASRPFVVRREVDGRHEHLCDDQGRVRHFGSRKAAEAAIPEDAAYRSTDRDQSGRVYCQLPKGLRVGKPGFLARELESHLAAQDKRCS